MPLSEGVGIVVIGRNEGERLRMCLSSLAQYAERIVYVDSGSTDNSLALAYGMNVEVVNLDMRSPFTAARARNEGLRRLRDMLLNLTYVQFVDADCEVRAGWLEEAARFLEDHPDVAVAFGRLREKHPSHSVYNMLCDMEWDTPVGESKACGGIAMIRARAFESVKGYRTDLIAGEEPELCARLRADGWRIWRLEVDMASHDAAMSHFGQWWQRSLRAGYAFAQAASLSGTSPERQGVRESVSAWLWGLGIPVGVSAMYFGWGKWAFALLLIYPLQIIRIAVLGKRSRRENWWRAAFLVIGKFSELCGQIKFHVDHHLRIQPRIIEHK